ncbi:hypothetical protein AOQ84DRAFT_370732 [Glonium stellatum]|uniref:Transcriptional regulatory protein RXT2 N-terminal domain-containing protein n=1 Tax=Glonium stellatum TaxID=574774 RepID=A0A8E2FEA1_9PEZI|nr:hypothetical protein AOQ84DRAFT_370732 [Glonium stellatum]
MAGQQQQIIDTIFSMKRKILRKDDSTDSEESDTPFNNRIQNLKRKARYSQVNKLDLGGEPPAYKRRIEHAGYHRYIIQRNPPRFDPDGDIVEYGDEYEDEDDLTTIEDNPYSDIQLENLLAPLTSAADLPNHPSMSIPYTSKHLTQLTADAGAISRKEQAALWRAKNLLTKLQGDDTWVPCGLMETSLDRFILGSRQPNGVASAPSSASQIDSADQLQITWGNGSNTRALMDPAGLNTPPPTSAPRLVPVLDIRVVDVTNGQHSHTEANSRLGIMMGRDLEMVEAPAQSHSASSLGNGTIRETEVGASSSNPQNGREAQLSHSIVNGDYHNSAEGPLVDATAELPHETESNLPSPPAEDNSETASQQTTHRMTTRARAQAISKTPSPPASPSQTHNPVHPMFKFPTDFLPDRDFGLPPAEAEDTRMLLLAWVQKQEEIARASVDLYMGMLQGERMRQDVFKWAKAEAHVGEMSDGEDWYDRDEWGLDEDLVKGRDEEEDEGAAPGKKSTRQRGRRGEKDDR